MYLNLYKYTGAKLSIKNCNNKCSYFLQMCSSTVLLNYHLQQAEDDSVVGVALTMWWDPSCGSSSVMNLNITSLSVVETHLFYAGVNKFFLCLPFTEKVLNISAVLQS